MLSVALTGSPMNDADKAPNVTIEESIPVFLSFAANRYSAAGGTSSGS